MTKEELIREIVSKICPFHGKKPIINMREGTEFEISTCCNEFKGFLVNMIENKLETGIENGIAPEITLNNGEEN
jgi:hypothetical protein